MIEPGPMPPTSGSPVHMRPGLPYQLKGYPRLESSKQACRNPPVGVIGATYGPGNAEGAACVCSNMTVVGTGVDPVTSRFSGARSTN